MVPNASAPPIQNLAERNGSPWQDVPRVSIFQSKFPNKASHRIIIRPVQAFQFGLDKLMRLLLGHDEKLIRRISGDERQCCCPW
jgi:hypothetical protein